MIHLMIRNAISGPRCLRIDARQLIDGEKEEERLRRRQIHHVRLWLSLAFEYEAFTAH